MGYLYGFKNEDELINKVKIVLMCLYEKMLMKIAIRILYDFSVQTGEYLYFNTHK